MICRLLLLVVLGLCGARSASADEQASATPPLRWRAVRAPADNLNHWPNPGAKYLPIEQAEFEQLLSEAGGQQGQAGPKQTSATAAEYRASLVAGDTLTGDATIDIIHQGRQESLFPLLPCGIAISSPLWDGIEPSKAVLYSGSDAAALLKVSSSGRLKFRWSLKGNRDVNGVTAFSFSLPASLTSRLVLDLPNSVSPLLESGLTSSSQEIGNTRRWTIEIGGRKTTVLKLVKQPEPASSIALRQDVVRQDMKYEFRSDSVEVSAHLKIDVLGGPISQISLTLDPRLRLVSAAYGELRIPWQQTSKDDDLKHVVLTLPEPLLGAGRVVQVAAVAPFDPSQLWTLPQIRCDSLSWQEGNTTLLVPLPLTLKELITENCRQSHAGALIAPATGSRIEVQCFSADAEITVDISAAEPRLQVESGTIVQLGSKDSLAHMKATLLAVQGEQFGLTAEVSRNWFIESVETSAENSVLDWAMTTSAGRNNLAVRFRKAITPDQPTQLTISARRRGVTAGERLSLEELRLLRFTDVLPGRNFVSVQAADTLRIDQSQPAIVRQLDPGGVTTAQSQLFPSLPRGLIYDLAATGSLQLTVAQQLPKYSADVQARASVRTGAIHESYTIKCTPEGGSLEKLLVHFSQRHEQQLAWDVDAPGTSIQATRLATSADPAGQGETWEVVVRPAATAGFELTAERLIPLAGRQSLSLAVVPQATSQTALLSVESEGGIRPNITSSLRAVPLPALANRELPTTLARYSYPSGLDALNSSESSVVVELDDADQSGTTAWAWKSDHFYQLFADGSVGTIASYEIENLGRESFEIRLPSRSRLIAILIDGNPVTVGQHQDDRGLAYQVPLPADQRFPVVVVRYFRQDTLNSWLSQLKLARPELDIPVVSSDVEVAVAPEYQVIGAQSTLFSPTNLTSWHQRLLGQLGRPKNGDFFDPLDSMSWSSLRNGKLAGPPVGTAVDAMLSSLSTVLSSEEYSSDIPLAEALSRAIYLVDEQSPIEPFQLLIDQQELERAGISRSTRISSKDGYAAASAATSALASHGLAILDLGATAVLTTSSRAATTGFEPASDPASVVYSSRATSTQTANQSDQLNNSLTYIDVLTWLTAPASPPLPWPAALDDRKALAANWSSAQLDLAPGGVVQIRLIRSSVIHSASWCVFLLVVGLAWWALKGRLRLSIAALLASALMAVFVPIFLIPVTSKLFLGILVGLACQLIPLRPLLEHRASAAERSKSGSQKLSTASAAGAALLLLIIVAFPQRSKAQAPPATAQIDAVAQTVHQVVIPTDENNEFVGGSYYLPEPFYQELYRLSRGGEINRSEPLIQSAHYSAVINRKNAGDPAAALELTADFDVQMLRGESTLRMRIGGKALTIPQGSVTLDGKPVEFTWDPSTTSLSVERVEPGLHRLQVRLSSELRAADRFHEIDVNIPQVATSTLTAKMPLVSHMTVSSSVGEISTSGEAGLFEAHLGPTSRIVMRWANPAAHVTAKPIFDVEQLLWLRVKPGSVVLDTRLRITVIEGLIQQVQLATDARVRPLPAPAGSAIASIRPNAGEAMTLELTRPITDQAVLDASFLLSGASGVGNLQPPRVEVLSARNTTRRLAISIDPSLEAAYKTNLAANELDDFLKTWGPNPPLAPSAAFDLPAEGADWNVAIRPNPASLAESQRIALTVAEDRIDFAVALEVTSTEGFQFQYRVDTPDKFRIENVRLRQDGAERPVNWSQRPDGPMVVRLDEPGIGMQSLLIRGSMRRPSGQFEVPRFRLSDSTLARSETKIYRLPTVVVQLPDNVAFQTKQSPEVEPTVAESTAVSAATGQSSPAEDPQITSFLESYASHHRVLVGTFDTAAQQEPLVLTAKSNRPQINASLITSVQRTASAWEAIAHVQMNVRDGFLDSIALDVPSFWTGPYVLNHSATTELIAIPGSSRQQLIVRPSKPVQADFKLSIRGPLSVAAGEAVRAPDINLRGVNRKSRYLLLPSQYENRQLMWDLRGRYQTPRRQPTLDVEPAPQGPFDVYELFSDEFQASLRSIETQGTQPRIRSITNSINVQSDGTILGVSGFDLEPAGRPSVVLTLPDGCKLINVLLHGRPAIVDQLSDSRWSINLMQSQLPTRVTVLYLSDGRAAANEQTSQTFQSPSLERVPVDEMLWEVRTHRAAIVSDKTSFPLSRSDLLELQWQSMLDLLTASQSILKEQTPADIPQWLRPWLQRCRELRTAMLRSANSLQADDRRSLQDRVAALDVRQADLVAKLDPAGTATESRSAVRSSPEELWAWSGEGTVLLSGRTRGASPTFTIYYDLNQHPSADPYLAGIGCIAIAMIALLPATRRIVKLTWLRAPHVFVTLLGIIWWLWLVPSFVGLLIVLVSMLAAAHARSYFPKEPATSPVAIEA